MRGVRHDTRRCGREPDEAKGFGLCFIRQEWCKSLSDLFWQIPGKHRFYWGFTLICPVDHTGLIGRIMQKWLSLWNVLLPLWNNTGTSPECLLDSWSPALLRPFHPVAHLDQHQLQEESWCFQTWWRPLCSLVPSWSLSAALICVCLVLEVYRQLLHHKLWAGLSCPIN